MDPVDEDRRADSMPLLRQGDIVAGAEVWKLPRDHQHGALQDDPEPDYRGERRAVDAASASSDARSSDRTSNVTGE